MMDVARVTPDTGAWPPGEGEVLLERSSLRVLEVETGDAGAMAGWTVLGLGAAAAAIPAMWPALANLRVSCEMIGRQTPIDHRSLQL